MKAAVALFTLVISSPLHAGVITQIESFDMSTQFPGSGTVGFPGVVFDSFPSNLGSLTRVDVTIQGVVQVSGTLPSSLLCTPVCVGQPFPFSLSIEHEYGLGFLVNPEILYSGQHHGAAAQGFFSSTTYSHSMSFTEVTDLIGIASVSSSAVPGAPIGPAAPNIVPAVGATALRSDFVTAIPDVPLPLMFLLPRFEFSANGAGLQGPFQGFITSGGAITLTYIFDDAVSVPAPGERTAPRRRAALARLDEAKAAPIAPSVASHSLVARRSPRVSSLPLARGAHFDEVQNLSPEKLVLGIDMKNLREMVVMAKLQEPGTPAVVALAEGDEKLPRRVHEVALIVLRHDQESRHLASGNVRDRGAGFILRRIASEVLPNRVERRIVGVRA